MSNCRYEGFITVTFPEYEKQVRAFAGESLLDVMRRNGISISADCNGIGKCGKCLVQIGEKKVKACDTLVENDLTVYCSNLAEKPGAVNSAKLVNFAGAANPASMEDASYAIAVDLGTTTIAASLLDRNTGALRASFSALNAQRSYGADVISRIDASFEDATLLCECIRAQLCEVFHKLSDGAGLSPEKVEQIVIAGNTAMSFLLLGHPCRSLGSAPFHPEFRIQESYAYAEIFNDKTLDCPVRILPYISAFVGGDIVSGLLTLPETEHFLLIDLGTNGEMILKSEGKLLSTSTAAGPAFEGGSISCGMGGLPGAIFALRYDESRKTFAYETIDGASPIGLCGSGILDTVSALLSTNMIDRTGAFAEPAEDSPILLARNKESGSEILFTQKDVREFQLSKGAIRAGIEVLLAESGGRLPDVVFLAGGFGQALNPESAFVTGLLPESLRGRVHSIGNSSLAGAASVCKNPEHYADAKQIAARGTEIILAEHPRFYDLFIRHMEF
ncbi:MAG: ASKHA domain-containing protein [Clostridiales Family XIII bacterium]|nr:ASKHA domain-containing protein [Clostridiales Family XIII bacterium]